MFGREDYDTIAAGAVSDFLDIFFFSFGYKAGDGGIGKFSYLVLTAHQPSPRRDDGLADFLFMWRPSGSRFDNFNADVLLERNEMVFGVLLLMVLLR